MNKKGFVFIETIVAIVILTSSLLLLYSTFTNILQSEKTRVYYDDINYVYRVYYLRKAINKGDLNKALNDKNFISGNDFFTTIGYEDLYDNDEDKNYLKNMMLDFEVSQLYIVKKDKLSRLKTCTDSCVQNQNNCSGDSTARSQMHENCDNLYNLTNSDMVRYFKSVNFTGNAEYLLIAEFNACDKKGNCHNYYSWIGVSI